MVHKFFQLIPTGPTKDAKIHNGPTKDGKIHNGPHKMSNEGRCFEKNKIMRYEFIWRKNN